MTTKLDQLRCIEAQIEEAIALEQAQPVRLGEGGRYEAIHIGSVLREALVHCQLLRRIIETKHVCYDNSTCIACERELLKGGHLNYGDNEQGDDLS